MTEHLTWVVMPVMAHPEYTEAAISDVLAQTLACKLLVINQGVDNAFRRRLEAIAEDSDRMLVWSHQPPLPSLAATWNRALRFVWDTGATEALVVNNDIRLAPNALYELSSTMGHTHGGVVTGVGVAAKQFTPGQAVLPIMLTAPDVDGQGAPMEFGGPDFSCFLISRETHEKYPFDEAFVPAYCEDLDLHRRMLLDGNGRSIFSINVPFLHHGSVTLKSADEKTRARIEQQTAAYSRAHYQRKWGGSENHELFTRPFDATSASQGRTTPELFEEVRRGQTDRRAEAR